MSKNVFEYGNLIVTRYISWSETWFRFEDKFTGEISISSMKLGMSADDLAEFLSNPYIPETSQTQQKINKLEETIQKASKELQELKKEIN